MKGRRYKMNILNIILLIIGIIYSVLTILVGSIQFKKRNINIPSSLLMIVGGILTILTIVFDYVIGNYTIYLFITGLVFIHISAINNGFKMYGKINIKHHIVRLSVSMLMVVLYIAK